MTLVYRSTIGRRLTVSEGDGNISELSTGLGLADKSVTYAKIQDISATGVLLGRKTAGSGVTEEITPAGDLTLSGSTFAIAAGAISYSKIQNISATNVLLGRKTAGAGSTEEITVAGDITQSGSTFTIVANLKIAAIVFIIDGGGSAITVGIKGDLSIPFGCTITGVRLLADQSGSIVVDIWKDTYANYPPTVADTITASAKPTITTATKSEDTTLTGWTTAITSGDTIRFNVDSITTCQRVTLTLKVTKT